MCISEENGQICLLILLSEGQITCSCFSVYCQFRIRFRIRIRFYHYCIDTGLIAGPNRQSAIAIVLVWREMLLS
jgi:hypothetical protein